MKPMIVAVIVGLVGAESAAASDQHAANGVWQSPSRGAHIQIVPCEGDAICGKLLSASRPKSNPQLLDIHNKDPAKRNHTMIGQIVFDGFKGGPKTWKGGRLYNPGDGTTIPALSASSTRPI